MTWKRLVPRASLLILLVTLASPLAAQGTAPEATGEPTGDTPPAAAENPMAEMMAAWQSAMTPGAQHAWLAESVGDWNLTVKVWLDPEAEPMVNEATASRTMILGGRYQEEVVHGTMMGMPFEGRALVGYDNVTDEYWSTWVDSMSTGVSVQRGRHDAEADTLTMKGQFVDPVSGEAVPVRSVIRYEDGREEIEFWETRDGQEIKTMELVYERASGDED